MQHKAQEVIFNTQTESWEYCSGKGIIGTKVPMPHEPPKGAASDDMDINIACLPGSLRYSYMMKLRFRYKSQSTQYARLHLEQADGLITARLSDFTHIYLVGSLSKLVSNQAITRSCGTAEKESLHVWCAVWGQCCSFQLILSMHACPSYLPACGEHLELLIGATLPTENAEPHHGL